MSQAPGWGQVKPAVLSFKEQKTLWPWGFWQMDSKHSDGWLQVNRLNFPLRSKSALALRFLADGLKALGWLVASQPSELSFKKQKCSGPEVFGRWIQTPDRLGASQPAALSFKEQKMSGPEVFGRWTQNT